MADMIRIPFDDMLAEFKRVLLKTGLSAPRANQCARIFTENSRDGIASHGYNRLLAFAEQLQNRVIQADAEPTRIASFGAWEQWDGNMGPGMLNALVCTDRVMALAHEHSMGCVALRNTNHWMRPGAYGWQAAQAGFIFMCWTNTIANMPPWGGTQKRVGNNPIVLAVPRSTGPVVLDMAMSQFSMGKTELYARRGQQLPLPGGYDDDGHLTTDAAAILDSGRALPIGYWKGSGLALLLDLIATLLSGGRSTVEISQTEAEFGVSQVYIAFDIQRAHNLTVIDQVVDETLAFVKSAEATDDDAIYYPGERVRAIRQDSLDNGIPIDKLIWDEIKDY